MSTKKALPHSTKSFHTYYLPHVCAVVAGVGVVVGAYYIVPTWLPVSYADPAQVASSTPVVAVYTPPPLDTTAYDTKLLELAHIATSSPWYEGFLSGTTTMSKLWPARAAYPADGRAILPANRIIAYYGNFYSKGMGILGEYPEDVVLSKLKDEVAHWESADPATPVVPAIEYIDVTAQGSAGRDGKYRARMPDSQIDHALEMAKQVSGIVILDIQVGLSTVQDELPLLDTYFKMPEVNLALDPEFSMKDGVPPGDEIGTMSSADINYTINYLSEIAKTYNLPPKILLIHRFTEEMVTGYQNIIPTPQVQVVIVMDGWGFPAKKINTYNSVIWPEPVQFTGIKLFYKNDLKQIPSRLMTDSEVLNLTPTPIYIQYQ